MCSLHYGRWHKAARESGELGDRLTITQFQEREARRLNIYEETGGACMEAEPCERMECRYHLAEMQHGRRSGTQILDEPCALWCADRGGMTLDEIGKVFGLARERIRQLEDQALRKLRDRLRERGYGAADLHGVLAALSDIG